LGGGLDVVFVRAISKKAKSKKKKEENNGLEEDDGVTQRKPEIPPLVENP